MYSPHILQSSYLFQIINNLPIVRRSPSNVIASPKNVLVKDSSCPHLFVLFPFGFLCHKFSLPLDLVQVMSIHDVQITTNDPEMTCVCFPLSSHPGIVGGWSEVCYIFWHLFVIIPEDVSGYCPSCRRGLGTVSHFVRMCRHISHKGSSLQRLRITIPISPNEHRTRTLKLHVKNALR